MNNNKVKVEEASLRETAINGEEQFITDNLVNLSKLKKFRSAWNFLKTNGGAEHYKFYNAGVVLEHLSNMYGDIGDLKDECILQKELERHVQKVMELLL